MRTEVGNPEGAVLRLVQLACALLLAVKIGQWVFAGVFMDEAYYWMWGQHPALSYYDHPPLNAWLLGLSSMVLGWSKLALRAPVVLAFAADIWAIYLISRRIAPDWRGHFWLTLLLFLATPVFSMVSNYALPDHVLLTALLFSIYFFFRFFADRSAGETGATRDLMLGALFLGLGGLAKYNAAFLGIGVAVFVLLYDRALLRSARIYLAGLLALALQAPVIIWNMTARFASYGFILEGRHAGLAASLDGLGPFALGVLVFVGPALFWPIGRFVLAGNLAAGSGFARTAFIVSTAAIVALAFTTLTLFHWNLVAYVAMLPFLALYMRPLWLLVPQALWGAGFALAILVNYSFTPLTGYIGWRDQSVVWSYDWSEVAKMVEDARDEHSAGFIGAADYTTASLLGFALKDPNVTSLSSRRDQFDYWFDPAAHSGQDAILYGDRYRPLPGSVHRSFASITEIAVVPVRDAFGTTIHRQSVYLARDYRPDD